MNRFRVLVVDDEPLALEMVAELVRQDEEVAEVSSCGDSLQVAAIIARQQPHILLLDIEMPGLDGIQLARSIDEAGPVVVFITAFSHYATRAFDVSAVDYVMKPFSDERLREALERAKRRVRERRLGELANQGAHIPAELSGEKDVQREPTPIFLDRLAIKAGDKSIVLKMDEIVWVEAEDYYVLVHSTRGRHLVRTPMASIEERLDPRRFVRVHRGALVNLSEVKEVDRKDGTWLVLSDGSRVPVSRSRRRRVEQILAPRLG